MSETESTLKLISGILLRSFIVAVAFLILWLVSYLTFGDYWTVIHVKLFDITEHELSLLHYSGMGIFKMLAFCFLFCPFVAIEWVIRSKKNDRG